MVNAFFFRQGYITVDIQRTQVFDECFDVAEENDINKIVEDRRIAALYIMKAD